MSETLKERWMRQPHFTCPRCDATSWNLNDVAHLYCGRCHVFFQPPEVWPIPRNEPRRPNPRRVRPADEPHRSSSRQDDDVSLSPFTFSPSPEPGSNAFDPPAADPSPSSIDPGGGSAGGGGASGDW